MGNGFAVNAADMHSHATHVRRLQRQVAKAQQAAEAANFSSTMFGTIGSKLVWPLMAPLDAAGQEAITTIDEIFDSTADAIDKVADDFEVVDGAVMQAWKGLEHLIEGVKERIT